MAISMLFSAILVGVIPIGTEVERGRSAHGWIEGATIPKSVGCEATNTKSVCVVYASKKEDSSPAGKNLLHLLLGKGAVEPNILVGGCLRGEINLGCAGMRDRWHQRLFSGDFKNIDLTPMDDVVGGRRSEVLDRERNSRLIVPIDNGRGVEAATIVETGRLLENVSAKLSPIRSGLLMSEAAKPPSYYSQESGRKRGDKTIISVSKDGYNLNNKWSDMIVIASGCLILIFRSTYAAPERQQK